MITKPELPVMLIVCSMLASLMLVGCGDDSGDPQGSELSDEELDQMLAQKTDSWNQLNNPNRFMVAIDKSYDSLSKHSKARTTRTPWSGYTWLGFRDSLNWRANQSLSPLEKYDLAFWDWEPDQELLPPSADQYLELTPETLEQLRPYFAQLGPAAAWQHEHYGLGRLYNASDDDGNGQADDCLGTSDQGYVGTSCDGLAESDLRQAWIAASLMEPEPLQAITVNDVDFSLMDLRALLMSNYLKLDSYTLGGVCTGKGMVLDNGEEETISQDCRGLNAGSFHVTLVNLIALSDRAFALDLNPSEKTDDYPVFGYEIKTAEELTEQEALTALGADPSSTYGDQFGNTAATRWVKISVDVDLVQVVSPDSDLSDLAPTTSKNFNYILELNQDGEILGGEWLDSAEEIPDFAWLPMQSILGNEKVSYSAVKYLNNIAQGFGPAPTAPDGPLDVITYRSDAELPIPDNDPKGVQSSITGTLGDYTISNVMLELTVDHYSMDQLKISLVHLASGKEVLIHDRNGNYLWGDNTTAVSVHDFDGLTTHTDWVLKVADLKAGGQGKITSWSLVATIGSNHPSKTVSGTNGTTFQVSSKWKAVSSLEITETSTVQDIVLDVDMEHYVSVKYLDIAIARNGLVQVLYSGEPSDDLHRLVRRFYLDEFKGNPAKGTWTLLVRDWRASFLEDRDDLDKMYVELFGEQALVDLGVEVFGESFAEGLNSTSGKVNAWTMQIYF